MCSIIIMVSALCLCIKWFEEKQQQFENLDVQLRKLHASVESLVYHRKGKNTDHNIIKILPTHVL